MRGQAAISLVLPGPHCLTGAWEQYAIESPEDQSHPPWAFAPSCPHHFLRKTSLIGLSHRSQV